LAANAKSQPLGEGSAMHAFSPAVWFGLRPFKVRLVAVLSALVILMAGAGVVASQGVPGSQSDKQPCTNHPCEGYVYEVQYDTADGKIKGAVAREATGEGAPPPGSGIAPQPGTAIIVLTDSAQIRLLAGLGEDGQDHYIDLETLTLKSRAAEQPSPKSDFVPPAERILVIAAAAIALAVLVPTAVLGWRRIRNRRSIG